MELIELKAAIRHSTGKSSARALRNNNAVPAIIYGLGKEPTKVSVDTLDLNRLILRYGTSGVFVKLLVEGDDKPFRNVYLKDVQKDVFGLEYLHVDFQELDLDEKISVFVPVDVTGESKGVKEGGLLQIIRRELEIICKPADKPEKIIIDITDLEVGDSVHVDKIDAGDNVEIPFEVKFTVLTIVPPTKSKTAAAGEEGEGEDFAEEAVAETAGAGDAEE